MKVRSKIGITVLACSLILGGCGGESYSTVEMKSEMPISETAGFNGGFDSYVAEDSYDSEVYEAEVVEDYSSEYNTTGELTEQVKPSTDISKEMLIYRGNVSITTKDFDEDLNKLKDTLNSFDCFFENQNKWLDYSYDDRKIHNYSATVRVKSSDYDRLLDGLNSIGTITNLSSSCENVSAEYSDTIVAIDIYEAERERYVNLLSTIMDDQYAIEVQRELTDIELKLAQYRARKQNIETDVSYSYVNIDLIEVREYEQQTEYDDNFFKRLWDTIVNTFFGFCTFLENFLFFLISIAPYVIFFWLIYIILKKTGVVKAFKHSSLYYHWSYKFLERKMKKQEKKEKVEALKKKNKDEDKPNSTIPYGDNTFF